MAVLRHLVAAAAVTSALVTPAARARPRTRRPVIEEPPRVDEPRVEYDDEDGLVRFDFERMSRVRRRGGRLRHISVEMADRAGFEPTSPAPKAGRISRLP